MADAYKPMPGFEWNPLRKYRNVACPCGSNLKVKRCHGKSDLIPVEMGDKVRAYLRALSAQGIITARVGHLVDVPR